MKEFRIIIAGSRTFTDYELLAAKMNALTKYLDFTEVEVISGEAKGADELGERWGLDNNVPVKRFPAQWDKLGRGAGHIRNTQMLEHCTHVVVFWDGHSRGSADMIRKTRAAGKPLRVVRYK